MSPDREFHKWAWPTFGIVFPLDLMLSLTIMVLCAAVALVSWSPIMFRAKLLNALAVAGGKKLELVEQLALSGQPLEIPIADAVAPVSAATLDDMLSGRKPQERARIDLLADKDQAKKDIEKQREARESGGGSTSSYVSSAQIIGSAIVVTGRIDGRDYELGFYPAALDEETPSVYRWLCGRSPVPEGWLAQPQALTKILPDRLLFRECQRRRGK